MDHVEELQASGKSVRANVSSHWANWVLTFEDWVLKDVEKKKSRGMKEADVNVILIGKHVKKLGVEVGF